MNQFIQGGSVTKSRIVYRIDGCWILRIDRKIIHLNHIVNVGKITGIIAVAINDWAFVLHELHHKFGNYRGIGPVGILFTAKHIKVT